MGNKKIIIGIVAVIIVVGVFLFLNFRGENGESVSEETVEEGVQPFIVKTSPWEPFMYEEDGEYKGISVDLLDLVMKRLNVDYEFELVPWSRAKKMSEVGEVDALLSAAYGKDRESFIEFTPEQRAYGLEGVIPTHYLHPVEGAFFVRTVLEDAFVFESIDQLTQNQWRIGRNQGYAYAVEVDNVDWNHVYHVTEEESIEALVNGNIDMFLTSKAVGSALRDKMGLQDKISFAKGPPPYMGYQFLLFSKNSDYPNIKELQFLVDEELLKVHEGGEYDEIVRRYVQE